jgi:hypothetical protein
MATFTAQLEEVERHVPYGLQPLVGGDRVPEGAVERAIIIADAADA